MSERRLVEVFRAKDNSQAHLLRSVLEGVGIQAFIEGDLLQGALGGIPVGWSTAPRIMVEEHHATKAREILKRFERIDPRRKP